MIKRCPTCNRTYSDESISFCLADGALLSAPLAKTEPPPTEILPPATPVQPTQAAKPPVPTMTSLHGANKYSVRRDEKVTAARSSSVLIWVSLGVVAIADIAGAVLIIRSTMRNRSEATIAAIPNGTPDQMNSTTPSNQANFSNTPVEASTVTTSAKPAASAINRPTPSPTPTATLTPRRQEPATLEADPALFPPVDYNRVFTQREVDTKAMILSRPKPRYTDAARQNQIQGTVMLRAILSANGTVTNISVVSGLPNGLSETAIAAARQMKFTPAMKDGRAVSVSVQVEYDFTLY